MKKIAVSAVALSLSLLSWSALAEEGPSLKEQCEAMGTQHGMSGEKMDAWMERCMDHTKNMKHDESEKHDLGEEHGMSGDDMGKHGEMDMQDDMKSPNDM